MMETEREERDSDMAEDHSPSGHDEEISDQENDAVDEHDESDESFHIPNNVLPNVNSMNPDVLHNLKMQVRDLKERGEEFEQLRKSMFNHTNGGGVSILNQPGLGGGGGGGGTGNPLIPPSSGLPMVFPFTHPAAAFLPPLAAQQPPPAPTSSGGSSHSSDGGSTTSSNQQTWSFEEQFKQVRQDLPPPYKMSNTTTEITRYSDEQRQEKMRFSDEQRQLYEINDDPKRKEFLDDLFTFMQKRGSPINRLPIMAKSVLDLYELYNLVIARGGLVDVINKKLWQEIIKGLHLPSSITSAAFTLRTQYMKYLYPYECEKKQLSTPNELQLAIDGNRREGRRSSYGGYDLHRTSVPQSQMSPMSLVSQQQSLMSRLSGDMKFLPNGVNYPSHPVPQQPMGPMPAYVPQDFVEAHMAEYVKMINKNLRNGASPIPRHHNTVPSTPPPARTTSTNSPISQLDMAQLHLWNMYNNNNAVQQQPHPIPRANSVVSSVASTVPEPQREALNLSDVPPANNLRSVSPGPIALKREPVDMEDERPAKRSNMHDMDRSPSCTPPTMHGMEEESPRPPSIDTSVHTPNSKQRRRTNVKITNRDPNEAGDSSMVVSMEINGIMYEGVLFAQTSTANENHKRIST